MKNRITDFMDFSSIAVHPVEAGTVIKEGDEEFVVDDKTSVRKGRNIYVTPKNYEALKTDPQIFPKKD